MRHAYPFSPDKAAESSPVSMAISITLGFYERRRGQAVRQQFNPSDGDPRGAGHVAAWTALNEIWRWREWPARMCQHGAWKMNCCPSGFRCPRRVSDIDWRHVGDSRDDGQLHSYPPGLSLDTCCATTACSRDAPAASSTVTAFAALETDLASGRHLKVHEVYCPRLVGCALISKPMLYEPMTRAWFALSASPSHECKLHHDGMLAPTAAACDAVISVPATVVRRMSRGCVLS